MGKLTNNQSGMAHLVLVIVLVAAIGLAGLIGYKVYERNNKDTILSIQDVRQTSGCDGEEPLPDRCQDALPEIIDEVSPDTL